MSNYALVFASGVGSRMRSTIGPKQFLEVKNKPILVYTLERFEDHDRIDGVYVVVRDDKVAHTKDLVEKFGLKKVVKVVEGNSESAHASIINGLLAMKDGGVKDNDIVLVHDGVRPIIDEDTISQCITTANKFGSAITTMPASETIAYKGTVENTIGDVTKRDNMIILQAPQSFKFATAYEVNTRAVEDGIVGTVVDQAELNRHYGYDIHTIEGLKGNVKVTYPLDFTYFEFLIDSKKYYRVIKGETV